MSIDSYVLIVTAVRTSFADKSEPVIQMTGPLSVVTAAVHEYTRYPPPGLVELSINKVKA